MYAVVIPAMPAPMMHTSARTLSASAGWAGISAVTIQTEALVQALTDGRLGGAGLDVTDPEPLPKGHPLWKFDNVIITPHIAGVSDGILARRVELTKENLRRFARGLPLMNVVDKKKGY
jgi:phosphoglycerate dehydrogenase-like enzyme